MYNYIGIINKSSAVNHSLTCNFLNNPTKLNLILAKSNIIEIYNITKDGLESSPYLNLYGRVILLEKIPASNPDSQNLINTSDNLFILTENLEFCILSYNKNKNEIVNLDNGSVKEDIGKRHDKVFSVFSPNKEYTIISAYKNIFKVIFLKNRTKHEDFSVRYEYEDLLFLFGLNFTQNILSSSRKENSKNSSIEEFSNTFGVIKVNNNYKKSNIDNKSITLETFAIDINKHEIIKDRDSNYFMDITNDPTCSLVISPKIGGLVVFYSNNLKYYQFNPRLKKIIEKEFKSYSDRKFTSYSEVDKHRYLIGDELGNLFLLAFKSENSNNFTNSEEFSLVFQFLGETNYPSTISYLDNNYIFIGSELANSQLIRIKKSPSSNKTNRPFTEVIEEFDNLAPISDFCVFNNNTNENTDEILCASGTYKSSCLKTVRKGTSIISDGEIPLERVKNIFSVNYTNNIRNEDSMLTDDIIENKNTLLFVVMTNETKILNYNLDSNIIEELKPDSGDVYTNNMNDPSDINLYVTNVNINYPNTNASSYVLQVTLKNIIIYNSYLKMIYKISSFVTPILIRYKKRNKMLYVYNKNNLLLRYDVENLIKQAYDNPDENMNLNNPEILSDSFYISAFDVSSDILIFSQWDSNKIFIFNLRNKRVEVLCEFEQNVLCTSIHFVKSEGYKFLFIALSNGKLLFYKLKSNRINLLKIILALLVKNFIGYTYTSDDFLLKRKYNITKDIFELKKIKSNNKNFLFINTDLPALLYINKEFPTISNFNIKDCLNIEQITSTPNDLYLFIFKDKIEIGSISNSQTKNISAKYINKQIYNLKNINTNLNSFSNYQNVISMMIEDRNEDKRISNFSFVILDTQLNEISRYILEHENEVCTNFVEITLANDVIKNNKKLFALGTGIVEDDMAEPETGHIYLIEMNENFKLRKVGEIETKGGVYKMNTNSNVIFVGISSSLYIYSINLLYQNSKTNFDYDIKLLKKHSDFTIINDIVCHDNYVLVSDIYKSITVFKYDEIKEMLIECCRDYNPVWCYSLAPVTNNIYIVSDIDGNIFSLRREVYPKTDEEKYKLERVNQINFGERVNKLLNVKKQIGAKEWEIIHSFTERSESKMFSKLKNDKYLGMNQNLKMNTVGNNSINPSSNTNELSITYFGTLDGTLGVIVNIPRETFEYLNVLQKEIIKVISCTGNLDFDKYRAFKDGFISDHSKGFVEGSILQEFLNFDHQYRIEFLKNIRYPWQININDTILLIESLLKLH